MGVPQSTGMRAAMTPSDPARPTNADVPAAGTALRGGLLFTDGGARGNPGPAAAGVVLADENGKILVEDSVSLGRMTDNAAEYHALIRGLQVASARGVRMLRIFSDSELVVNQVRGDYAVRDPTLAPLHQSAGRLLRGFVRWEITHIPREQNADADRLVNLELDRRGDPADGEVETLEAVEAITGIEVGPPVPPPTGSPGERRANIGPPAPVLRKATVRAQVVRAEPRLPWGKCDLAVGQVFDFAHTAPAGVPLLVLQALLPYVVAMRRGAEFAGMEPGGLTVSCSGEDGYYLIRLSRSE
jgi:ribonuclease HI